jgi:hypothetical protein
LTLRPTNQQQAQNDRLFGRRNAARFFLLQARP